MSCPPLRHRRDFLKLGLSSLATAVTAGAIMATPQKATASIPLRLGQRTLTLYNLHTDEKLDITYMRDGAVDPYALHQLNIFLRDYRTGDITAMNPRLFHLITELQHHVDHDGVVEIISAYRSPRTNMKLASLSRGVAKHSYHTRGMAIDLRLSGVPLPTVHKAALSLQQGGVGYYPSDDFVHVDVGPVRRWG